MWEEHTKEEEMGMERKRDQEQKSRRKRKRKKGSWGDRRRETLSTAEKHWTIKEQTKYHEHKLSDPHAVPTQTADLVPRHSWWWAVSHTSLLMREHSAESFPCPSEQLEKKDKRNTTFWRKQRTVCCFGEGLLQQCSLRACTALWSIRAWGKGTIAQFKACAGKMAQIVK